MKHDTDPICQRLRNPLRYPLDRNRLRDSGAATDGGVRIMLIVACGGGRNSAMLLGMAERAIRPDYITFADTGGEKPETYEALERLGEWSKANLGVPITTVRKTSIYKSLEDQCLSTGTLPSAAYGWRSCSDKWKIQPQDKFFNNLPEAKAIWKNGELITKALGYDAGERRRGQNIKEDGKYSYWFPLQEWGWYLEDCIEAFNRHGLPVPPKSACFYCPSSKKQEVIELHQRHPDLFERAVNIESIAQSGLKTVKGLGRHWRWDELVAAQHRPDLFPLFTETADMNCTCADSED